MEKKIRLFKGYGKYVEDGRLILVDEPFLIKLIDAQDGIDLFYQANNGKETISGKIENCQLKIERGFLKLGRFKLKIVGMVGDEQVCEYKIDDLIISELKGNIEAIPEIEFLRQKIEKIELLFDEVEKLNNSVKTLAKAVMKIIKVGGEE